MILAYLIGSDDAAHTAQENRHSGIAASSIIIGCYLINAVLDFLSFFFFLSSAY